MPPLPPPTSDAVRRTRTPAYVIAGLLLFIPIIELVVGASPYRIHDPTWRIGLVSGAANASTTLLLALLVIYVVGVLAEDHPTTWLVAGASALMVLFCVVGSGAFALDALQMRAQVRPGFESRYNLTTAWGLAKVLLAGLGALVLFISAYRSGRSLRRVVDRRGKKASVLVTSSAPVATGSTT